MNTINENEVRLANLQAAAEMRRAELARNSSAVASQVMKVVENAIAASGVNGYALRKDENGGLRDAERMTLCGKIDGERLHDIDICFRRGWGAEDENEPRAFSVSTCCFGSVTTDNKVGIAYCVLVGYLAAHLQEIQDALNAIPEWEVYDRSRRVYYISRNEAEAFERKMADEAKAARLAEVEKRLVVGAVVATEKIRRYDIKKHQSFYIGVKTMVIEKVTAKLVFFKSEYRQYKKADVLELLAKGLEKGGWSFEANVDMSKFPCPVEA